MTLLVLFAFALQSYVAQTHFHGTFGTQTCISKCVAHTPVPHSPFDDPGQCPFCQAVMHAGLFFVPTALAILAPDSWAEHTVPAAPQHAPRAAPARNGFSRAPPR